MALYPTKLVSKSRVGLTEKGKLPTLKQWIRLSAIKANATFVLPANVGIVGDIVIANGSGTQQAAITIGTAAAGTQVSAGVAVPAGLGANLAATRLQPAATDRTIYVESAAWQTAGKGVTVFIECQLLPTKSDTTAIS